MTRRPAAEHGAAAIRVVIVALVIALAALTLVVVRQDLAGETTEAGDPGTQSSGTGGPLVPAAPAVPTPVLKDANGGPVTSAQVRHALRGLLHSRAAGRHLVVEVARLTEGRPLLTSGVPTTVTPASTTKLLTTSAALDLLGPDKRFSTTVVTGASPRAVVLVGGGDPLLTVRTPAPGQRTYPPQATLSALARQTARSLRERGVTRVHVGYDASLFTGPAVNPHWPSTYIPEWVVSPISALWVDEGRAHRGYAARVSDPAAYAAGRFAALLRRAGIKVEGGVGPRHAPSGAHQLARVQSAPLAQLVQFVLENSDNEGAEVLLRQAAIGAGRPASFKGGVAAVRATWTRLGLDLSGDRWYDGSGLSRDDRLSVSTLVQVLQTAAAADHPNLRPVVSTLPVAGFTGSLAYRFVYDARAGLGVVRAKTGTLTGVHALAGLVVDRQGTPLVFAAVADRVPVRKTLAARAHLDRIAAALASCC